jgi:hypothetical protein
MQKQEQISVTPLRPRVAEVSYNCFNEIELKLSQYDDEAVVFYRSLPFRKFNRHTKMWSFPKHFWQMIKEKMEQLQFEVRPMFELIKMDSNNVVNEGTDQKTGIVLLTIPHGDTRLAKLMKEVCEYATLKFSRHFDNYEVKIEHYHHVYNHLEKNGVIIVERPRKCTMSKLDC